MNKEIIVYKGVTIRTGDRITCTIGISKINDAKIYISPSLDCGRKVVYICQNKKKGNVCEERLGYKYSWLSTYRKQTFTQHIENLKLACVDELALVVSNVFGVNDE